MSHEKSDSALPTYEESLSGRSEGPLRGQQIIDQLTNVRSRHIRDTIDGIVYPSVEEQAIYGIANTTIALVPSDAVAERPSSEFDFGDQKDDDGLELVGFPSDEVVQQVKLKGPLNRTRFWRQAGVVGELQRTLQDRLSTAPFAPIPSPTVRAEASVPSERRAGLLRRRQENPNRSPLPASIERAVDARAEAPASGLRAQVALEEICFRTVSDFGLYETISRPAVIIRVVAGL